MNNTNTVSRFAGNSIKSLVSMYSLGIWCTFRMKKPCVMRKLTDRRLNSGQTKRYADTNIYIYILKPIVDCGKRQIQKVSLILKENKRALRPPPVWSEVSFWTISKSGGGSVIQGKTNKQLLDMHYRFQQRDYKNELLKGAYGDTVSVTCSRETQEALNPHKLIVWASGVKST